VGQSIAQPTLPPPDIVDRHYISESCEKFGRPDKVLGLTEFVLGILPGKNLYEGRNPPAYVEPIAGGQRLQIKFGESQEPACDFFINSYRQVSRVRGRLTAAG
jgi:hypothetical protein